MEIIVIIILVAGVALGLRLVAGSMDGDRIESYVRERGWQLLDKSWDPLGPGWFGEKNARIYEIVYQDRRGNVHKAHVKTSLLSGVYLTNDRIVRPARAQPAPPSAPSEEERLRQENEELRRKLQELGGTERGPDAG